MKKTAPAKKNKKVVKPSKICLDTPFVLARPNLHQNVHNLIRNSLIDVLANNCDRRSEYSSSANPKNKKSRMKAASVSAFYKEVKIGFNAVMKGIERDELVCVFVNMDAKPAFLVDSFIPVCQIKCIPLIFIKGLPDVICKATGITKALAVGLKKSVRQEGNIFNKLYEECVTATCNQTEELEVDSDERKSLLKKRKSVTESPSLSDIKDCYLKIKIPSERVFKPPKLASKPDNVLSEDLSFITLSGKSQTSLGKCAKTPQSENTFKTNTSLTESFSFIIDTGDSEQVNTPKQDSPSLQINDNNSDVDKQSDSFTKKRKISSRYFNAQVKRVKANSDRKKSK